MESYTYEQLKDMTVAQLREIANSLQNETLQGSAVMHKDHLLPLLCKVLGIHVHHAAQGERKLRMKATIRKLKTQRDALIASGDHTRLAVVRHQVHVLKRKLRRMAAQSA